MRIKAGKPGPVKNWHGQDKVREKLGVERKQ